MVTKIKNFFLTFSVIFLIASITSFTAYNWDTMTNFQKLGVPASLIIIGFIVYIILKKDIYKSLALFFTCFIVGTLFAVFGQVYQTGADSWILFRNWAIFLIIPAIFSMYYSIYLLLTAVLSFMTFFYFDLFYEVDSAYFIATLIPALIIIAYPIITEKLKLTFNNYFFNSLVIPFFIFFNIGGVSAVIKNDYYYYKEMSSTFENILVLFYPLVTGLIFLVVFKKYKKQIVLPFIIVTGGLILWAFFAEYFDIDYDPIMFFFISLIIFTGTLVVLFKTMPPIENEFITKLFKSLGSFLKFFIFLSALGMIVAIIFKITPAAINFLFLGIIIIAISCYLPKFLNYKEDKLDFVSFTIGLSSIIFYLGDALGENLKVLYLVTIALIIFDVFWLLRPNKAMDLLFAPAHYIFILVFLDEYKLIFDNFILNSNLISTLGILIIPLQLIFAKQIENSKFKDKINRIFYGNNISLLLFFVLNSYHTLWGTDYLFYGDDAEHLFNILVNIKKVRNIIIFIISIFIIYTAIKSENLSTENLNLENKDLDRKVELKKLAIFIALIVIIQYFSQYVSGTNFIILLILLYTYRNNKWTTYLLNIVLSYQIFKYYIEMYHITLLQKSYYLLILGLALMAAYLIVKYFIKEVKANEQ